ncbi:hypothetical protein BH11ACT8_BH11ACT8_04400 [soil metagenome]
MSTSISFDIYAKDRASGTLRNVGDAADRSSERWRKLGSVARTAGLAVAAGATAAGIAAYKAGQSASDLSETISKTNQVFGEEGGAALDKWAAKADKALGQSKQTALDAAATFGIFGKSAGKSGDDLVKFAEQNTKLATDLASFNNTSPEQAIEAIGAAFRGESEPLRSYGVLLDDATLRNEALKLGLIKTTKDALTPQQKVLAAQSAIMKQTTDQQGDFARTSGGLANQQRILQASLKNTQAEMGTKLLPVMVNAANCANDDLMPAIEGLWRAFDKNGIDGLVAKVERLTGTEGKLTPILEQVKDVADDLGTIFTGSVVPAFEDAANILPAFLTPLGLAKDLLGFMADNTDLVKVALEGYVLYAGLAKTKTLLMNFATKEGATNMQRLGSAAKSAAGMAGMGLLAASAETSNDKLKLLGSAGGGALAGFAVGGPVGAAVGFTAGALIGLNGVLGETQSSMEKTRIEAHKFADILDVLAAKPTAEVRNKIYDDFKKTGALEDIRALGLNVRNVVLAAAGDGDKLNSIYKKLADQGLTRARIRLGEIPPELQTQAEAYLNLTEVISDNAAIYGAERRGALQAANATGNLIKLYKGLPKEVVTRIKSFGGELTRADLVKIQRQYDLTPKELRILVGQSGVDATVAEVRSLAGKVKGALAESQREATSGGQQIGSNIAHGAASGITTSSSAISTAARQAVTDAILAAKEAARIKSPSQKMRDEVGKQMGAGLAVGLFQSTIHVTKAARDLMAGLVHGIDDGFVTGDRVLSAIERRVDQTAQKFKGLLSKRSDSVSALQGFSTSVFAATAPESGGFTVDGLLQFQSDQATQAAQVKAAVSRLTQGGLSGSLLKQLQSSGSGGIDQLLALSTGTDAQIALFNKLNKQTQSSLGAAGLNVGNTLYGDDIKQARRDKNLAQEVAAAVKDALHGREAQYEFVIRGDSLVAVLNHAERTKGKR